MQYLPSELPRNTERLLESIWSASAVQSFLEKKNPSPVLLEIEHTHDLLLMFVSESHEFERFVELPPYMVNIYRRHEEVYIKIQRVKTMLDGYDWELFSTDETRGSVRHWDAETCEDTECAVGNLSSGKYAAILYDPAFRE